MNKKQRLFVDMDGTLSVFTPTDTFEELYEEGYFLKQAPLEHVVSAIRRIIYVNDEIEVYILSAYLSDSNFALEEKNAWLDDHMPEIDQGHRIFIPYGSNKMLAVPGGIRESDCLLDDYTVNLKEWQRQARGIKLLNGINHTKGTWQGDRISCERHPADLANIIISVMQGRKRVFDKMPHDKEIINKEAETYYTGDEVRRQEELVGASAEALAARLQQKVVEDIRQKIYPKLSAWNWLGVIASPDIAGDYIALYVTEDRKRERILCRAELVLDGVVEVEANMPELSTEDFLAYDEQSRNKKGPLEIIAGNLARKLIPEAGIQSYEIYSSADESFIPLEDFKENLRKNGYDVIPDYSKKYIKIRYESMEETKTEKLDGPRKKLGRSR